MLIRKPEILVPLLLLVVANQATKAETLPWMIEIAPMEMTRQECVDSNGIVVADVGDGSSRLPDYRCASNGKGIIGVIYTLPGEYLSDEGEVCCGIDRNEENPPIPLPLPEEPLPQPPFAERPSMTIDECRSEGGGVVGDPGDGSVHRAEYTCESSGEKPLGTIVPASNNEPIIIEGAVCCGPPPPRPPFVERTPMTIDECRSEGGGVIGDPGNGSVHRDEYTCESNGEKPLGTIFPASNNEPIFIEGAVCCGPPPPRPLYVERTPMTIDECRSEGGEVVGDPGNGSVHRAEYTCERNGEKPLGTIVPASNNEPIFIEGAVCCGPPPSQLTAQECLDNNGRVIGYMRSGSASRPPTYNCDRNGLGFIGAVFPPHGEGEEACCGPLVEPPQEPLAYTRQECRESNGVVVGDIGDGSSRRPNYRCPTNGEKIMGIVVPLPGEPIAREGEVCCGAPDYQEPFAVNFKECAEELNGIVVYDIGNGSSRRPGYRCENTGEPILAIIVPAEGEPRPREGAVCCGAGDIDDSNPSFPELTRDECELEFDGIVIGDIGNGATLREDYRCITNGEPIIGVIVASSEFDFIAIDGEVCCQLPGNPGEGGTLGDNCHFMCQMIAWIDGLFGRD